MSTRFARRCASAGSLWLCAVHAVFAADDTTLQLLAAGGDATSSHLAPSMPAPPMPAPPPAGVGAARLIKPGQVMLMYQFMHADKRELVDGDDHVSTTEVATQPNHNAGKPGQPATYRSAPESMEIDMHMFGVQAGITDDLSAMIGVPYLIKERKAVTFAGASGTTKLGTFENESSGFGDVSASALYRLYDDETHHLHAIAGLSFPTGSIREKGRTLAPNGTSSKRRLAYGLQLGTGTYDLLPGLTYWGASGAWNWGLQAIGRIPLGENDENYTFGDRAVVTAWGGYSLGYGVTLSGRLIQEYAGDISGKDEHLTGPSPTTDPDNYGGWKTSAAFGVSYRVPTGALMGFNPGVEVVVPLYQNLNGPQLADSWAVFVGVRKVFTF